ncbi:MULTISPECIES: N-acetyl-gamma-glutamyl-phosphate reductase [Caproicibacterium]|jgi:N-acetyl-gamma-glutamyl-phosphate reductase|uniref:N-acetyl-gamma-glutamyl-phosphate reductase n=1 Tax=Caproicibacterium lactatifermentans TaxID=2666138 RepID=A0A859DSN5_9FIRM|nr:N-acetyl-gamma-glutamyl-phosphate reductase [Caproicibacterium lactatifermentans]ARP49546.1 N-acetyl-gamma-glutamyl-phosphate reductase [Ruminococcaceae bacterium CPB6]MDD4807846.1 N-acetyl-gamma-glutamyl-phosphate reductase [Oscillospiraceae bacterium]QKN23133.1 N-acetyl-gamma-glutamyl-phosphate reductase [Caproicibacterium lactatifermentans]QKO30261.1 N-acetyl-gamma-glutamyl-phosphate reductase [Caproicibacterium lactatifermentans]
MTVKAGIIGATGYAGAELVRILSGHPQVQLAAVSSVSFQGKPLSAVYPAYYGLCDMVCGTQEEVVQKSDAVFAALPHGLSQPLAKECHDAGKVFIDLGADFRLERLDEYEHWYGVKAVYPDLHAEAVYGLPEFFREQIRGKKLIANPGCYTTAVPLALVPALKAGLISNDGIIADCKSGVTGAGRKMTQDTHYPELNEGMHAYKVGGHRHTPEIEQTLRRVCGEEVTVTFTPHLLPVNRGILATCYAHLTPGTTLEQLQKVYEEFYKNEFFVRVLPQGMRADIHHVRYSNFCEIELHIDPRTQMLVAVSALDNMVKGAAGQAVQNMNLSLGLPEKTGLTMFPPAF